MSRPRPVSDLAVPRTATLRSIEQALYTSGTAWPRVARRLTTAPGGAMGGRDLRPAMTVRRGVSLGAELDREYQK